MVGNSIRGNIQCSILHNTPVKICINNLLISSKLKNLKNMLVISQKDN